VGPRTLFRIQIEKVMNIRTTIQTLSIATLLAGAAAVAFGQKSQVISRAADSDASRQVRLKLVDGSTIAVDEASQS
jgi:ferric-dicitrate binding protein FerR (iron transport regulator)